MRIIYGYRIDAGHVVPDEKESEAIRTLFTEYLSGKGIAAAARTAGFTAQGLTKPKRILADPRYCGTEFFPPIIPRENFEAAQAERTRRAQFLGRDNIPRKDKWLEPIRPAVSFRWKVPGVARKNAVPSVKPCSTVEEAAAQAQSLYHMIKRK